MGLDRDGDEWSNTALSGWKEGVVDKLILPFIGGGQTVLEIGPGSGRWTQFIVQHAAKTILVDVTPECIDMCRERFASQPAMEYHVNDGRTMPDIQSASVDRVFSFDVFVHIQAEDVDAYVGEIARVLRTGGEAMVHHSKNGSTSSHSWRSDMTAQKMCRIVEDHGLTMLDQFETWGDGLHRLWPNLPREQNRDVISRFRK